MVREAIAFLKADIEAAITGDIARYPESNSALAAAFGGPADAVGKFRRHADKLKNREKLTSEEEADGARTMLEIARSVQGRVAPGQVLECYSTALQILLSIEDIDIRPFLARDVFEEVAPLLKDADTSQLKMFDSLRRLANLPTSDSQSEGECEVKASNTSTDGAAPADSNAADNTVRRIDTERQLLLEASQQCLEGVSVTDAVNFRQSVADLAQLAESFREAAPTPAHMQPMRRHLEAATGCAVLLFFLDRGLSPSDVTDAIDDASANIAFAATLAQGDCSEHVWSRCMAVYALLQSATDWLSAGYLERPLHGQLRHRAPEVQEQMEQLRANLSDQLADLTDMFEFEDFAEGKGPVADTCAELDVLCGLAMARENDAANHGSVALEGARLSAIPEGVAISFIVNLTSARSRNLLAVITFQSNSVCLFFDSSRSDQWLNLAEAIHTEVDTSPQRLVTALRALQQRNPSGCWDELPALSSVSVVDLTGLNVPIDVTDARPEIHGYAFSKGHRETSHSGDARRAEFWGAMRLIAHDPYDVDSENRVLEMAAMASVPHLEYPRLPDKPVLGLSGSPAPLPFAHFEKWSFEDLQFDGHCDLCMHTGADARREDFLRNDWGTVDILHISTHGMAYSNCKEAAHLLFAGAESQPTRLHYLDILSQDFSGLELVFLNACLTKFGKQWTGNEDLSLGWAFRAAGAGAVIAARWPVADSAAWYFASHFYDSWLKGQDALRTAFNAAIRATRANPLFADPHLWGAFVLLD